jgi:alanine racemase
MHRNGVSIDELEEAFELIKTHALKLKGIFTHHSSADTLGSEFFTQEQNFKDIKKSAKELIKKYNFTDVRFHSLNSAGVFRRENFAEDDMVRVGIAMYGCLKMDKTLFQPQLKPLLSLYAKKISTRALKKSQRVGYNGIYTASKDMIVTNYDIGYADGLLRTSSNNYTSADGKKLLGRISMDNSTFEGESEEIKVFDDASKFAKSSNTISYEVLTSLKSHLKRSLT